MALTISIEGRGVIANCDAFPNDSAGGTWSEQGAGTISLSQDVFLVGSACIGGQYASKVGLQQYDLGAGNLLNFNTTHAGQFLYIWVAMTALGTLDVISTFPLCIRLSSSSPGTSNYIDYVIAGNDDKNGWAGGFKCFVIDPTKIPSRVSGTQSTIIGAVRTLGIWIDTSTSARADSIFIDQIAVGKGLRVTGTSTTGWKDVVDYCTDYTNRGWGMFQEREGIYYSYGKLYIGSTGQTSNVSFEDSGRIIQYGISEYYTSGGTWESSYSRTANGLVIEDNISYTTNFTDGVIVGIDNGRSGSVFSGNLDTDVSFDFYGGNNVNSLTSLYGTTLKQITGTINSGNQTGQTFLGVNFLKCSQFDPVGVPMIRNCTFAEYSGTTGAALLWNSNIDILNCNFISNNIASIQITSGTSHTFSNLTFSSNNADVNNTVGSTVTITNDNSDASSYTGTLVNFQSSTSITVIVEDSDQIPIQNAYIYLMDENETLIENTISDINGTAILLYVGAVSSGTLRIRKYGYEAFSLSVSLDVSSSINVTLVTDPVQTASPPDLSANWAIDYTGSTVTNNDINGNLIPIITGGTWFVDDINDFFRWLANDFASGDTMQYQYPINALTPTVYEWVNGWGFGRYDEDYKYLKGGSIVATGSTDLWSNLYSLGSLEVGSFLYINQNYVEIEPWWITGDIDILIRVKSGGTFIQTEDLDGTLIDGGVVVFCREIGNSFDHNFIDLSDGSRNPIPINNAIDTNNASGEIYITVASATGFAVGNFIYGGTSLVVAKIQSITNNDIYLNSVRATSGGNVFVISETITEYSDRELQNPTGQSTTNDGTTAYTNIMTNFDGISITIIHSVHDIGNGAGSRPYEATIDCSGETLLNVYQYLKYVTRYGSSGLSYTIGTLDGQFYRNPIGYTWIDLKLAPFGTFAGGKFFGARGIWIENMDASDITNYQLLDADNVIQTPPVQYSIILTGLKVDSEIRIYSGVSYDQEIAGIENSTTTFSYTYTYTIDIDVKIVIHNINYVYISFFTTLSNSTASIPIQQQDDRWFNNPV